MSEIASQAARNQYKSDIFFSQGNTSQNTRPVKEFLKSNLFSSETSVPYTHQIKRTRDQAGSDIFNTSYANEINTRQSKNFNAKKTNIVFGDAEPVVVKKDKTKPAHNPDPYYKQESAANRRLKEFYGENDYQKFKDVDNDHDRTLGTMNKEANSDNQKRLKEFSNPSLTARERKMLANHSSLAPEKVKDLVKQSISYKNSDSKNFNNDNSLVSKVNEMKSNIFYDPQKEVVYQNFKPSKKQEQPEEEKKQQPNVSKFSKNLWNDNDNKDSKNEISSSNNENTKNVSSFERKIKSLQGNISEKKQYEGNKFEPVPNPIEKNREELVSRRDINSTLREAIGNDDFRLKKNLELSSVHQGSDFYQNNAKYMKNVDVSVKSYEIKDIPNFENLKVNEIESVFRKKGIHIYDVKTQGNIVGKTSGDVSFKVRGVDDDLQFKKNFEEVTSKLQNDLNLNVEPTKARVTKKMTETLPADLKWNNPHIRSYGNKEEQHKVEHTKKKEGKFSNSFAPLNTGYKNFNGLHGFSMK